MKYDAIVGVLSSRTVPCNSLPWAAGNAMAADPAAAKTRVQVQAELFEAQRAGDGRGVLKKSMTRPGSWIP